MTFDATVNPVAYEGGEAVFIDTEYDTWNIWPVSLLQSECGFRPAHSAKIV